MAAATVLLIIAFLLNRARYQTAAVIITIIALTMPSYINVFFRPETGITAFVWLIIPIMVASVMLSIKWVIALTTTFTISILIILPQISGVVFKDFSALFFILPVASILSLVITASRDQDKKQIEQQLIDLKRAEEELIRINNTLETRVKERTAVLSNTNNQLEETMELLKHSNQELEQFAYIASHDLQEPVRMITSYLQLIKRRYEGQLDSDADDFINFAVGGAVRIQRMINALLTYSRVNTKGGEFLPVSFEVIFNQVIDNLQVAIRENDATVTHDPLPTLVADEVQMVHLLQNLVINAINYRREEPPMIHVSAKEIYNAWVFTVSDNGIGIEPQYFERVFMMFQRLHNKRESGSGVGLAICRRIIDRHNGNIWIESEVGKGSRFRFTIPIREENNDQRSNV
jgi:light-regulated signal transduction histidine kinase (bacteriophytochrome)